MTSRKPQADTKTIGIETNTFTRKVSKSEKERLAVGVQEEGRPGNKPGDSNLSQVVMNSTGGVNAQTSGFYTLGYPLFLGYPNFVRVTHNMLFRWIHSSSSVKVIAGRTDRQTSISKASGL